MIGGPSPAHDTVNKIAQNNVLIISNIYNPGQKVSGHLPFSTYFCMEFAVNLQYIFCFCHEKIKFISSRHRVISSIYYKPLGSRM